jgi:transposase
MKPYSLDLRRRIVDTYTAGGISQRQLADRFCVKLSFVSRILKRYSTTNSLAPKVRTQQTPSKLNEEQLEWRFPWCGQC